MGVPALTKSAVFLDRDGVLNRALEGAGRKSRPPATPEALEILPGVPGACEKLRRLGFLLIVVSNQPDVARGRQTRQVVEAINAELVRRLPLNAVRVCYHDTRDGCSCRKPAPGLLLSAADEFGIDLNRSFMVGDRQSDIAAGKQAGCRTVLVGGSRIEPSVKADYDADSLVEAADWIGTRLSE